VFLRRLSLLVPSHPSSHLSLGRVVSPLSDVALYFCVVGIALLGKELGKVGDAYTYISCLVYESREVNRTLLEFLTTYSWVVCLPALRKSKMAAHSAFLLLSTAS
jgi:hypothetical protein